MSGWVKIDRRIFDHWIFADAWKFRNWIDLLGLANYNDATVEIGGQLFECKRGQSLHSLTTLSSRWKCDKSKVRRFLKLLEKDDMIRTENLRKTTRITICNYDSYQMEKNADESVTKRRRNADETQTNPSKKNKKDKKVRIEEFRDSLRPYLDEFGKNLLNDFFMYWTEETPKGLLRYETQKAFSLKRRLTTWNRNQKTFFKDEAGDELMQHVKKNLKS